MQAKPHQERAQKETIAAIEAGEQRICVTAPTGAGKSFMQRRLMSWAVEQKDWDVQFIVNRKALLEQSSVGLEAAGISHGIRASGYERDYLPSVQLTSIHTEHVRVYKTEAWSASKAKLLVIDEAHQETKGRAQQIIDDAVARGAHVVSYSATPAGIGHLYTKLIVAGTNSEMRECGLHVPCKHFTPDEPDMKGFKANTKTGEYSENDVKKAIMTPTVFGRVYEHFKKLNPDKRPTILFGPDVKGSMFFAEQFTAKGVRMAHVDGEDIWLDGKVYKTSKELRAEIIEMSKDGSITGICNRYVFREALDLPWLSHGIGATVFGSIVSFLQSGGRILRAYPGLEYVTWQDHGGNILKHGSLNADREWHLWYDATTANKVREDKMREKTEHEPISCPVCHFVRATGKSCPQCGHEHTKRSRFVVQTNGKLVEYTGEVYKPIRVEMKQDTEKLWQQMYYRAKQSKKGMSFHQARGLFRHETGYYPPATLDLMPKDSLGWHRRVRDVGYAELNASLKDKSLG